MSKKRLKIFTFSFLSLLSLCWYGGADLTERSFGNALLVLGSLCYSFLIALYPGIED